MRNLCRVRRHERVEYRLRVFLAVLSLPSVPRVFRSFLLALVVIPDVSVRLSGSEVDGWGDSSISGLEFAGDVFEGCRLPRWIGEDEFEDFPGCLDIGAMEEIEAEIDSGAGCRAAREVVNGVDKLEDIGGILGGEVGAFEDELEGRRAGLRAWSPQDIDGVLMSGSEAVTSAVDVARAFGELADGGLQERQDLGELLGRGPSKGEVVNGRSEGVRGI